MVRVFFLFLLLLVPDLVEAEEISVGGVPLTIPRPDGFSPVTPDMEEVLGDLYRTVIPPTNEQFLVLIPDDGAAALLHGELPTISRQIVVQTSKDLVEKSTSSADFASLKAVVKHRNQEIFDKAIERMPELAERFNQGMAEAYGFDPELSVMQMVPLPPHEETKRTLSFSAWLKYDVTDENGQPSILVAVSTVTIAHVKEKVLFLYCYADGGGLEWSREASRRWVKAIFAENPSGNKLPRTP